MLDDRCIYCRITQNYKVFLGTDSLGKPVSENEFSWKTRTLSHGYEFFRIRLLIPWRKQYFDGYQLSPSWIVSHTSAYAFRAGVRKYCLNVKDKFKSNCEINAGHMCNEISFTFFKTL